MFKSILQGLESGSLLCGTQGRPHGRLFTRYRRSTRTKDRLQQTLEHDPEKWEPVFREDHAQKEKKLEPGSTQLNQAPGCAASKGTNELASRFAIDRALFGGFRDGRHCHELRNARFAISQSVFRKRNLHMVGADLHRAG